MHVVPIDDSAFLLVWTANPWVRFGDHNHASPLYSDDFVHRCAVGTTHVRYHAGKTSGHPSTSGSTIATRGITASAPGNRTAAWRPPPDTPAAGSERPAC